MNCYEAQEESSCVLYRNKTERRYSNNALALRWNLVLQVDVWEEERWMTMEHELFVTEKVRGQERRTYDCTEARTTGAFK